MKKSIATLVSLFYIISLYAQSQPSDSKPKGMQFVPQGSFQMEISRNSETRITHVSVDAFWMSNEITNSEYREYVDYVKQHPNDKICWVDFANAAKDKDKGILKTKEVYTICIKYSEIIGDIIDSTKLPYNDYFSNKKYDSYPVVGVSFKMAKYFCLWKTMLENEKMKEKGLSNVHYYRIPLETEWEYVAQQSITKEDKGGLIQKVNDGNPNELGLFHLDNNVSEWVTPMREEAGIVRGGSWKSEKSISARQVIDPNSQESTIGFRIVQSYITEKK